MKKCPYCAEEIQHAATKCQHCGEMLSNRGETAVWHQLNRPRPVLLLTVVVLLIATGLLIVVGRTIAERNRYYKAASVVSAALQRLESDVKLGVLPDRWMLPHKKYTERLSEVNAAWAAVDGVYEASRGQTKSFVVLSHAVDAYNLWDKLWLEKEDAYRRDDYHEAADSAEQRLRETLKNAEYLVDQATQALAEGK